MKTPCMTMALVGPTTPPSEIRAWKKHVERTWADAGAVIDRYEVKVARRGDQVAPAIYVYGHRS